MAINAPQIKRKILEEMIGVRQCCLFLLVWIEGVYFFYYFGKTFQSGSPSPTSEPMSGHGKVVYVTRAQKAS